MSLLLSNLSDRDKPWDYHRFNSQVIANRFLESGISDLQYRSDRINNCSRTLKFWVDDDSLKLSVPKKFEILHNINRFCRDRLCLCCQWRRSLRWKAQAYAAMQSFLPENANYRWLFLTLTIRSPDSISQLRAFIDSMNKAFRKLATKRRSKLNQRWPALGYIKSLEITRNSLTNRPHPHFHCLLVVGPEYYHNASYLKQEDWINLWQQALGCDYQPNIDIRAADLDRRNRKKSISPLTSIPELLKYTTKESDFINAPNDWLYEYAFQIHRTRAVEVGGILKDYFSVLEEDPDDLIGASDVDLGELPSIRFHWNNSNYAAA